MKINNKLIPDIYSTDEVETNKIWINGKNIYRKCFKVSVTQKQTDITIPDTLISNIDEVTDLKGMMKNQYLNFFPINYLSPNGQLSDGIGCYYNFGRGIVLRMGNINIDSNSYVSITIEYTKGG